MYENEDGELEYRYLLLHATVKITRLHNKSTFKATYNKQDAVSKSELNTFGEIVDKETCHFQHLMDVLLFNENSTYLNT